MEKPILTENDIDLSPIEDKTIAILGYGNQGRPHALNLRDSGLQVIIGGRDNGTTKAKATNEGFDVFSIKEATQKADVIMMMVPDDKMGAIYSQSVEKNLKAGQYLGFCHGLGIHAGWVQPSKEVNVFLVAPKGQGRGVRNKFLTGSGVPALYAIHQDPIGNTRKIALAYAKGIGSSRAGVIESSFKEETECDLFSEQAVLCGGLTMLIKSAFETLVENGFSPEAAYFECLYEVKLIADLIHEKGITGMRQAISSTALFGDISQGHRVIDSHVKENMRQVLEKVTSGEFVQKMEEEFTSGEPLIKEAMEKDYHHLIERTHRYLTKRSIRRLIK